MENNPNRQPFLIEVRDLSKQFEADDVVTPVLFDLNFHIRAGEFVAIMGPSGSGKSTLMHILGFLDRQSKGVYLFKGQDVAKFDDEHLAALRNKEVGFVFQQFNLLPKTSVQENVRLPLVYTRDLDRAEKDRRTVEAVEAVGLTHRINNLSNQLSGGEKQRVAIARALVTEPSLIFADEPTGNLDSRSGAQIMEILAELNEKGKTIILVTHEQYTAEYAARIIKLKDGRITADIKLTKRRSEGLVK